MTSRNEIIKEICRMNHRILDILQNDRQTNQTEAEVNPNQVAVSMMASQVVNTQPNPNQVQISQTNKVCPIIVISDDETDDDVIFSGTIAEPGQNINTKIEEEIEETSQLAEIRESTVEQIEEDQVDTNSDISGNTMDELNRVIDNQNIPIEVKDDPEMTSLSVNRVYMSHLTESELRTISSQVSRKQPIRGSTQTSIKYQESSDEEDQLQPRRYHQESDNHNNPTKRSQGKTETDDLNKELIEIGKCELPYLKKIKFKRCTLEEKRAYDSVLKMVRTLFGRFSEFENPNGGSFYISREGIRQNVNGDIVNKAVCYGFCKHKCPVKLTFYYKRERSVYELYRSGTHNHELTSDKFRLIENLDDLNIKIYSSKIAPKAK